MRPSTKVNIIEINFTSQSFTIIDSIQDTILLAEGDHLQNLKNGDGLEDVSIIKCKLSEDLEISYYKG